MFFLIYYKNPSTNTSNVSKYGNALSQICTLTKQTLILLVLNCISNMLLHVKSDCFFPVTSNLTRYAKPIVSSVVLASMIIVQKPNMDGGS